MHDLTLDESYISLIKHIFGRCSCMQLDNSHGKVKKKKKSSAKNKNKLS